MFVPKLYEPDSGMAEALVRRNPFATLVTNGDTYPYATHLATVIPPSEEEPGSDELVGRVICGHMNRSNPHWARIQSAANEEPVGVLIHQGPDSYVSPSIYQIQPAAPTWNFTSVHLRGRLRPIQDRQLTMDIICWTVAALEAELGLGWDMAESMDYFHKIVPGVGSFELQIESVEAMFKLSQEQPEVVRERVRLSFGDSSSLQKREVAQLMGACPFKGRRNGQRPAREKSDGADI